MMLPRLANRAALSRLRRVWRRLRNRCRFITCEHKVEYHFYAFWDKRWQHLLLCPDHFKKLSTWSDQRNVVFEWQRCDGTHIPC